jgi:hypothetical protein
MTDTQPHVDPLETDITSEVSRLEVESAKLTAQCSKLTRNTASESSAGDLAHSGMALVSNFHFPCHVTFSDTSDQVQALEIERFKDQIKEAQSKVQSETTSASQMTALSKAQETNLATLGSLVQSQVSACVAGFQADQTLEKSDIAVEE